MISVIVPVYNRAHYITECLNSVFKQTFRDYEVILVDDGSTDNIREVLSPYSNRIHYFYKGNGGAASARNMGINKCKGEFVAWLDSDDKWFEYKTEIEAQILKKIPNLGFVYSDFSCFTDSDGIIAQSYIREYLFILKTIKPDFLALFKNKATIRDLGIVSNIIPEATKVYWGNLSRFAFIGPMFLPTTVLVRKRCLDKVGYLNEQYETGEDYDLHVRLARNFDVAYLDFPTALYRRFHSDQLTSPKMEIKTNKVWLEVATKYAVKDREFYLKNKRFVEYRLAFCYYGLGTAYLRKGEFLPAIKNFILSVIRNPIQKRIYFLLIFSLINEIYLLLKIPVVMFKSKQPL